MFCGFSVKGQSKIDSLRAAYETTADPAEKVVVLNKLAWSIRREDLIGSDSLAKLALSKAEELKIQNEISELSAKQAQDALELSQQRNWIIGLTSGVLLILIAGGFLVYRRKKRVESILTAERLTFQKRLIDSTVEAEEKQRQRIAKDLHNGLVQWLAALKLGVQNAMNTVGLNDGQKESFQDHIQNIDTAAEEARSISHQMMPRH